MERQYKFKQVSVRIMLREEAPCYSERPITNKERATHAIREYMQDLDREIVVAVNLDNKSKPINWNVVSTGSINASIISIPNIFKTAILSNAAAIMLFHCHPSGVVTPSKEDRDITNRIVEAGRLMEIPCLDHIIVGCGTQQTYSFREMEFEIWEK